MKLSPFQQLIAAVGLFLRKKIYFSELKIIFRDLSKSINNQVETEMFLLEQVKSLREQMKGE